MSRPFQTLSEKEITMEMEDLVKEGRDAGMDQAQIITTDKVVVDDRVSYKCMFSCSGYNTNLQCPPFSMKPAETRELLQKYSYGIFYRKKGIPEHFCGLEADKSNQWAKISRELQQTMANLEASAFYKGFYFALALGGGRCRICSLEGKCEGLENRACIQPFMSRPSMEAIGIDVYSTLRGLNWEFSVIGKKTDPKDVETAGYCGLLLLY